MHANTMTDKTGVFRLDAVSLMPSSGSDSLKISTLDCSSMKKATPEETATLEANLAPEAELQILTTNTYSSKRDTEVTSIAPVTNLETLALCLASDFDPNNANAGEVFQATYEVPSVIIAAIAGPHHDNAETMTYAGCTACNFEKLGEDGKCLSLIHI